MNMIDKTLKLAYGENSDLIKDKRIAAIQALSGTGACRVFAEFQKRFSPDSQIYIPVPTWSKLVSIAKIFIFMEVLMQINVVLSASAISKWVTDNFYLKLLSVITTYGEMPMSHKGHSIIIIQKPKGWILLP